MIITLETKIVLVGTFLDFPVSLMKCSSFSFWDTSGIRMISPSSNRISLAVSPMVVPGLIQRCNNTTENPGSCSLYPLPFSLCHRYLSCCKITSIMFLLSKSRKAVLGFLLGGYSFIGRTVCLKFPRAFPIHLLGHAYTNHWQKEM